MVCNKGGKFNVQVLFMANLDALPFFYFFFQISKETSTTFFFFFEIN